MARFVDAAQALAITLWVGALWTTGLLVASVLFQMLDDRTLAGTIAGRLFEATAFIGLICGACLLVIRLYGWRDQALRHYVVWLIIVMLAFALIGQFGIAPILADLRERAYPQQVMQSTLSGSFAAWHAVAGVLYLVQCLLGAVLVISNRGAGAGAKKD